MGPIAPGIAGNRSPKGKLTREAASAIGVIICRPDTARAA